LFDAYQISKRNKKRLNEFFESLKDLNGHQNQRTLGELIPISVNDQSKTNIPVYVRDK